MVKNDTVNHPSHYTFGNIEVIDVIEDWKLGYHLGNVIKYVARCEHKQKKLEDLKKARWYLKRFLDKKVVNHVSPFCTLNSERVLEDWNLRGSLEIVVRNIFVKEYDKALECIDSYIKALEDEEPKLEIGTKSAFDAFIYTDCEETDGKVPVKVKKLDNYHDNDRGLKYAKEGDAGFDLYSSLNYIVKPSNVMIVETGVCFEIPKGYHIEIRPRSGLAVKGLTVVNSPGTIDSGYRGEIKVILGNVGSEPVLINQGDRIAQAVLIKHETAKFEFVKELSDSERGEGGFGSTG